MLNDALSSSHFAISGKLTGHDAIVVRGACADAVRAAGRRRRRAAGGRRGPVRAARRRGRAPAARTPGPRLARRRDRAGRGARRPATRRSPTTGGTPAAAAWARCMGAKRLKAVAVRAAAKVAPADPAGRAGRRAGPAGPLVRPGDRQVPRARHAGQPARVQRDQHPADPQLPGRDVRRSAAASRRGTGPDAHASTRNSCASCTIGCEHIYSARGGKQMRVEYENVFALGPMCGVSDPDAVLAASGRCDELGLDTISAGGTIAWAMECAERGLIDAPWLRFGDSGALLRALDGDRCPARARRAAGRGLAAGGRAASAAGRTAFAPQVKGLELPGYEPRTMQAMALGLAVNSRGADHNRSGAYEADLSGQHDRLAGGQAQVAAADRDRGPGRGHGLADPVQVPARGVHRAVRRVGGAAVRGDRLGRSTGPSCGGPLAGSSWPSAYTTSARAGGRRTTGCRERLLSEPLRSRPAGSPTLTPDGCGP